MRAQHSLAHAQRAFVSYTVGRAVLQQCVEVLQPLGIAVLPLKGFWLQHFVYGSEGSRLITDIDVLVPEGKYQRARLALMRAGWRLTQQDMTECVLMAPGLGLPLDLHAHLYTRGAFRTSVSGIFARATADASEFGCPVMLPDPLDVLSHLVGHALKSGAVWTGAGNELSDIPRLLSMIEVSPQRFAARLSEDGLARAARFVLPALAGQDGWLFARDTLDALPDDRVGVALASVAQRLQRRSHGSGRANTLVGFMLDSSLFHGAGALSARVLDRSWRRVFAPKRDVGGAK